MPSLKTRLILWSIALTSRRNSLKLQLYCWWGCSSLLLSKHRYVLFPKYVIFYSNMIISLSGLKKKGIWFVGQLKRNWAIWGSFKRGGTVGLIIYIMQEWRWMKLCYIVGHCWGYKVIRNCGDLIQNNRAFCTNIITSCTPPYCVTHTPFLSNNPWVREIIKVVGLIGKSHIFIDMFLHSSHPIMYWTWHYYAIYYLSSHITLKAMLCLFCCWQLTHMGEVDELFIHV